MSNSPAEDSTAAIAIIGLAGRFPGAKDIAQFWQNLRDGVEPISFFCDQELESAGVSPALLSDPSYVKAGSIIDDIELFDAAFFGFTPREAEVTDPQHRLFLECAWEALENAGIDPHALHGTDTGVFAGAYDSDYGVLRDGTREVEGLRMTGGYLSVISGRVDRLRFT